MVTIDLETMQVDSVSNCYSEWSVFATCSCSSFDVLLDSTNAPTHSVTLQVLFSEVHDLKAVTWYHEVKLHLPVTLFHGASAKA